MAIYAHRLSQGPEKVGSYKLTPSLRHVSGCGAKASSPREGVVPPYLKISVPDGEVDNLRLEDFLEEHVHKAGKYRLKTNSSDGKRAHLSLL